MDVIYMGTADFQEFGPEDFQKANIEQDKRVRFPRGEAREVSDEVGTALVSDEGVFGDFEFVEADELTEEQQEMIEARSQVPETNFPDSQGDGDPVDDSQLPAEGEAATTEGTADPAAGATSGPTSTGRGTSTGARGGRGGRGTTGTGRGSSTGGNV